jgi:hypothetical protein
MKHVLITDKKYRWGALFLTVFIAAAYITGAHTFATIAAVVFLTVGVIAYFKLRK